MSFSLCPECKSIFTMSATGTICDNCYYRPKRNIETIKIKEYENLIIEARKLIKDIYNEDQSKPDQKIINFLNKTKDFKRD